MKALKKWSGIGLLTSLFDQPDTPKLEKPKTAPTPDDKTSLRARQKQIARSRTGGRASTMLTEETTLG